MLSDLYTKTSGGITLAKDVLKTDSTATEAEAKSSYVKYNGLDCRVLYNDDTHGLQIITADSVEAITLGFEDGMVTSSDFTYNGTASVDSNFKKAAASYNNAVNNLNRKAKSYMDNKGIARDARCLGSIPTLTSDSKFQGDTTTEMWSGSYPYLTIYSWNNKFQKGDTNYIEDVSQLNNLGLNVNSNYYTWLASREVYSDQFNQTNFYVLYLESKSGSIPRYYNYLCRVNSDGSCEGQAMRMFV